MTETERFGITTDNENLIVILYNDVELSQLQVCDKLNELSNEKSHLQCRLKRRTRQRDELAEFNVELMEENNELKDMNEQLKSTIDEMIKIFQDSGLDYVVSEEVEEILNE